MRKKLALLLFRYFPYGGLQKDFLGIAKELIARDHELKVYTRTWEGAIPADLDVFELGKRGVSNYSKNKNYVRDVHKSLQTFSPDITFGFNKMPGLDLYFAADTCFAKQSKKKNPLQKFTRRSRQSFKFEKMVFSPSSNSKLLLLNENQKSDFKEIYSTQSERMTIIPPGIDRSWNQEESINVNEVLQVPKEDKIILFVGSDFFRKGLDRAILGLTHLNEKGISATLIVIGDDKKDTFQRLLKDNYLISKVIFLGPRQDVASFMKSSDLLVHPAREEAAGNIIIEAMVSGLPSLVSNEVGFSNEVRKYNAGEVVDGIFKQDKFNHLLEEMFSNKKLSSIKSNISHLSDSDYFFSRFEFIADFIEDYF